MQNNKEHVWKMCVLQRNARSHFCSKQGLHGVIKFGDIWFQSA